MDGGGSFERQRAAQAKNVERQWRNEMQGGAESPLDAYRRVCEELDTLNKKIDDATKGLGAGAFLRGVEMNAKDIKRILELEDEKRKLEVDNQLSGKDLEDNSSGLESTLQ